MLHYAGPVRLDGVEVIGVDEHEWAHLRTAEADGFVTVVTDLPRSLLVKGMRGCSTWCPGAWRRP